MNHDFSQVEQDAAGITQNELPTYEDLAAHSAPNSRWRRWNSWIQKRAAERYDDLTPEELARRRERGWDLPPPSAADASQGYAPNTMEQNGEQIWDNPPPGNPPTLVRQPPTPALHIQTTFDTQLAPYSILPEPEPTPAPLPLLSQPIPPSHLRINHFGSRFLPHSTAPIHCLLPLLSDTLLLIGSDDGLSVIDMFPQEWGENGQLLRKSPNEAEARQIWTGEGVYQMSLLEVENTGDGKPQGVVLILVGTPPESPYYRDDCPRTLRMYNLASLISLAKWSVAQKGSRPIDMKRPGNWQVQQTPPKKHKHHSSIARSLKNLIDSPHQAPEPCTSSYQSLLSPSVSQSGRTSPASIHGRPSPSRHDLGDSGWDLVEDLPLRWATDFVPLASPGSRLCNVSVLSFTTWSDEGRKGRGGQMLAIATKTSILLYETPKGERSFRFVKEFYTPFQPKSMTFFHQVVQDVNRHASQAHHRQESSASRRRTISLNTPPNAQYSAQLSLFIVFSSKKAGSIRVLDSAVGEIDLYDDGMGSHHSSRDSLSPTSSRRSVRASFDNGSSGHAINRWIPLVHCSLPRPGAPPKPVCLLTKGKTTHILPHPLPANISAHPPLQVIDWQTPPRAIVPRVWDPSNSISGEGPSAYIQVTAFSENGIEVQEVPLTSFGKGKARAQTTVQATDEFIGPTGFLAVGGNWDDSQGNGNAIASALQRSYSTSSAFTDISFETDVYQDKLVTERGIYGWCQKGVEDYRVFWVGGPLSGDVAVDDDDT